MDILVLVAGTNDPSNSHALANAFAQGIQQEGDAHIHTRRLKDLKINHFTIDFYEKSCTQEEDFCMLQDLIEKSSGLVIASPIWNFGVPAHLKNLIDRMGSFALDETRTQGTLNGKPFYLIFTGGAPGPAWALLKQTTSSVPVGLQYFGATLAGTHYEPRCTKGKGKFGLVVDERPRSLAHMRKAGEKFAKICRVYHDTGKLPAMMTFRKKIFAWGERVVKKIG
jgi:multimeric flavodoxin WrbA